MESRGLRNGLGKLTTIQTFVLFNIEPRKYHPPICFIEH